MNESRYFEWILKKTVLEKPLAIGDTVYIVLHDEAPFIKGTVDAYMITKTTVTDISENHGFTLSCDLCRVKDVDGKEIEFDSFRDWEQVGERVFLDLHEAEEIIKNNDDYNGYKYSEEL